MLTRKRVPSILWTLMSLGLTSWCTGEDRVVEMFERAFVPQAVSVELGDTVTWLWRQGEHTVTSGLVDGAEGTLLEPGALFDAVLDADNPVFTYRLDSPDVLSALGGDGVPFFDRRQPGQVGFVEVLGGESTFRVGVVDNAFVPREAFVFEGDTVLWEHEPNEAFHTVTSGLSSLPEDSPGALFDEESSEARPTFTYRFDSPGQYPYFCRPHEAMAMNGVVHVQQRFLRGDATGEGKVNVLDAVEALSFLFRSLGRRPCEDALDANDDGRLDLSDPVFLLGFLFLRKAPLPRPYPFEGVDASDDGLRCLPGPL